MRARKAFAVCYPESCSNIELSLANLNPDGYAYILHDMDVLPTGELKKPHYHVYLEWENQKDFGVVASELGTTENQIEKAKSTKGCVRYLAHADNPDKHQYEMESIMAAGVDIEKYFTDYSECSKVAKVLNIIRDNAGCPFDTIIELCAKERVYDVLRRGNVMFLEVWRGYGRK